jgi:hypothetical protein
VSDSGYDELLQGYPVLKRVVPDSFSTLRLRSRTIGFCKKCCLLKDFRSLRPLLADPFLARAFFRRRYRSTHRAMRTSVAMKAINVPTMRPVSFLVSLGLGEVDGPVWLL